MWNRRKYPRRTSPLDRRKNVLDAVIAYNKYGGYCVPISGLDRPAVQRILAGEIYEPDTIEFLVDHIDRGDIVHAGTYFGDFLPAIASACTEGGVVWAFEPNGESFRCAKITVALNELQNVRLTNFALAGNEAERTFLSRDERGRSLGGSSRLVSPGEASSQGGVVESVQSVAIDDVLPSDREVSVIQFDLEGFEQEALTGALETIRRCLPIIVCETLPAHDWLEANLFVLGYEIGESIHHNTVLRLDPRKVVRGPRSSA